MSDQSAPVGARLIDEGEQIVIRANYEIFVLALSVLQILNSILIVLFHNQIAARIPIVMNYGLAAFFISDAFYRLWRAHNRRRYLLRFHGYLVFLGSLPVPFSALLRLVWYRYVTVRLRRADFHQMGRIVVRKAAQSAMLSIILIGIIVLEVSSIAIIELEIRSPDANILTPGDAMWWAMVTMATVGYGDYFPVTTAGRFVAMFVMVVGVGIYSVMTSYLAQNFMQPRRTHDEYQQLGVDQTPDDAQRHLETIKQILDQQDAAYNESMAEVREKLTALEDQVLKAKRRE